MAGRISTEVAGVTQQAIFYYETEAGFPPAPAVIDVARALQVSTDELLGVRPPRVERIHDDTEARHMWKRFQMVATLPGRGDLMRCAQGGCAEHGMCRTWQIATPGLVLYSCLWKADSQAEEIAFESSKYEDRQRAGVIQW